MPPIPASGLSPAGAAGAGGVTAGAFAGALTGAFLAAGFRAGAFRTLAGAFRAGFFGTAFLRIAPPPAAFLAAFRATLAAFCGDAFPAPARRLRAGRRAALAFRCAATLILPSVLESAYPPSRRVPRTEFS
ncbi:MAG: hypothetical protein RB148_10405, partial [Armatimonadota bacterium]|nr:hypothetical protein [Armatimonadota bacterium]